MGNMRFTSRDAARVRFRGTRFAYDRSEVDAFHREVVMALTEYEAALEEAEAKLTRLSRSNRGLVRAGRGEVDGPHAAPTAAAAEDPLAGFHRWRADKAAQLEIEAMLGAAREEAAMIRATTAVRAADEIERMTAEARTDARAVTKRAAALAAETEEAARQRAGEILDDSDQAAGRDQPAEAADMQVLSERIVRLRSSIADVQSRLESLSSDEDDGPASGEIIDLRNAPDEPASEAKPQRRRTRVAAMADAEVATEALEAKMADLKRRLASD